MEPILPLIKLNKKPQRLSAWLTDPFLCLFIILIAAGYIISSIQTGSWAANLIYIAAVTIDSLVVLFLVRTQAPASVAVPKPGLECAIMAGWYVAFMIGLTLTKAAGIFADEFSKWLWFIILPLVILFAIRGRSSDIKTLFRSVGFRRQGIGKAALIALIAYVVMIPAVLFTMPYSQLQKLGIIFRSPVKALVLLPVAFLFSLITAAGTEEIFFRGILQQRIARALRSELRACLIAAFLFGIYHLPYAYFLSDWPTHGNFTWAFSSVLVEQMMAGLILGILWLRTRNIAATILFHALVDTIAIMTMLPAMLHIR